VHYLLQKKEKIQLKTNLQSEKIGLKMLEHPNERKRNMKSKP